MWMEWVGGKSFVVVGGVDVDGMSDVGWKEATIHSCSSFMRAGGDTLKTP